jgi:hypothetical protein
MIDSIHCAIGNNIGDNECYPLKYFNFHKTRILNIMSLNHVVKFNSKIILGGGGLLSPFFIEQLQHLNKFLNHIPIKIIWGIGINEHYDHSEKMGTLNPFLNQFNLVGIRDYNTEFEWVPCVSCMSDLFTSVKQEIIYDVVVYEHYANKIDLDGYEKLNNGCLDFEKVINFLNSAETVITNSYHGVYWATLLNKKVVVYEPFSTRFNNFKHEPTVGTKENIKNAISISINYPDALKECREANINFYSKVFKLLT